MEDLSPQRKQPSSFIINTLLVCITAQTLSACSIIGDEYAPIVDRLTGTVTYLPSPTNNYRTVIINGDQNTSVVSAPVTTPSNVVSAIDINSGAFVPMSMVGITPNVAGESIAEIPTAQTFPIQTLFPETNSTVNNSNSDMLVAFLNSTTSSVSANYSIPIVANTVTDMADIDNSQALTTANSYIASEKVPMSIAAFASTKPVVTATTETPVVARTIQTAHVAAPAAMTVANYSAPSSALGGQKILQTGQHMALVSKEIIKGASWSYVDSVYTRAGYPRGQRTLVFKGDKNSGLYANLDAIQAGDWLYYRSGKDVALEHSGIFINWVDRQNAIAKVLTYASDSKGRPGFYQNVNVASTYQIIRPRG